MRSTTADPQRPPRRRARSFLLGLVAGTVWFLPVAALEWSGEIGLVDWWVIATVMGLALAAGVLFVWTMFGGRHSPWGRIPYPSLALVVGLLGLVFGLIGGGWIALRAHHVAVAGFVRRSQPVVDAIASYTKDAGKPPVDLAALVPGYLPEVPATGVRVQPQYDYICWEQRWSLGVSTGLGYRYEPDRGWHWGSD